MCLGMNLKCSIKKGTLILAGTRDTCRANGRNSDYICISVQETDHIYLYKDWSRSGGKRWKCKVKYQREKLYNSVNTHKGEIRKNIWKLTFVYHENFPTKVNFQVLMPCPLSPHTSTSSVMNLNNDWSSWKVRPPPSLISAGSLPASNWPYSSVISKGVSAGVAFT